MLWMCFLVVPSLTTGQMLFADNSSATASDDKVVPIKSANGTAVVKVQEADPYKNLHVPPPSEKYDPRNYSMNQTSPMANKSFSANTIGISKNGASFAQDQGSLGNKSFADLNSANFQNGNKNYTTSASSDNSHTDMQFNKNYATPHSTMGSNSATAFNLTSSDQDHSAALGGQKTDVYSANLAKQYVGPGAQHVPDGSVKDNVVIDHVSDIPNRPLTIDEVRGLINHGFKPDTTVAPDSPTRAMNDPDYKPEASPEPPETSPPPMTEDDKNDPLPSPGTMSQPPPENSEPLPQH